jgi:hypothetical protein
MSFYYMDFLTNNGSPTLIHNFYNEFPDGSKIINDVEGDSSSDSRYWSWQVLGKYDGSQFPRLAIITYDKNENKILGVLNPGKISPTKNASKWINSLPRPNMVEISPDGKKVITHFARAFSGGYMEDWSNTFYDGPHAWNLDMTGIPIKIANTDSHSGWGWVENKPVFISQNTQTDKLTYCYIDETSGAYPENCVNFINHSDWNYVNLHFGKMPISKSGWILISTYQKDRAKIQRNTNYASGTWASFGDYQYLCTTGGTTSNNVPVFNNSWESNTIDGTVIWTCRGSIWPNNQILMVELKGINESPRIWRICPTYNTYDGNYRDEAIAAISYTGKDVFGLLIGEK